MKNASHALREIRHLDPKRDHQQIVFLSLCYDFPIDSGVLSVMILLRSFSALRISKIVDGTGIWHKQGSQRAASLVYAIAQLIGKGYDSESGRATIARMNAVHGHYKTNNDDFVYLLSRFVFDPVEWNDRFGWRRFCEREKLALYYFWQEVGRRMNIRDVPQSYEGLKQFMIDYEREQCRPAEANLRLYVALRDGLAGWLPAVFRPFFRLALPCVLDATLRQNLMLDPPSRFAQTMTITGLRLRAWLGAWLPSRCEAYPLRDRPPFFFGRGDHLLPQAPASAAIRGAAAPAC
ncbi:MAG TPA: oxygenase MpaB family protein [Gemmataceae bacterium]|nr:oxygenase MpaB family protein [Gemmataceae bacterium]